jgi:acyl-CoA synthetase (AMP-forming)/AMP-acid ligase II
VIEHLEKRLAGYNVPRHIRFVKQLPMSAQGKVLKKELRCLYAP